MAKVYKFEKSEDANMAADVIATKAMTELGLTYYFQRIGSISGDSHMGYAITNQNGQNVAYYEYEKNLPATSGTIKVFDRKDLEDFSEQYDIIRSNSNGESHEGVAASNEERVKFEAFLDAIAKERCGEEIVKKPVVSGGREVGGGSGRKKPAVTKLPGQDSLFGDEE